MKGGHLRFQSGPLASGRDQYLGKNGEAANENGLGGQLVKKQVACHREQDTDDRYHSVEQNLQRLLAHVGPMFFLGWPLVPRKGTAVHFKSDPLPKFRCWPK